ncbi:MAG: histidinol-phosphate transaminase [Firmicutes bacterium]|nr:histidinol-phosphate transaminase [Bacillota bacterium]
MKSIQGSVRPNIQQMKPFPQELPDLSVEEIKEKLGMDNVYKLSFNENFNGPSPAAVKAMQEAAAKVNFYPSSYSVELSGALAGEFGVENTNLLLSNGADEMINLVAQTFAGPGDRVIFPSPSFGAYAVATRMVGAEPVPVPLLDYTVDLDAMLSEVDDKVKLIYICNPNNPTGTMLEPQKVQRFLSKIPSHVMVMLDEAYMEFTPDPQRLTAINLLNQFPNIGVIRTFSKIYGLAGARVGYLIAGKETVCAVHKVRPPFNVNGVAQAGALAALKDRKYMEEMRCINDVQRQYLEGEINRMGMNFVPSCANFLFIDTGGDAGIIYEKLVQRGIVVRPGAQFGEPGFMRVSVGSQDANRKFISALREIMEVVV